jgi:short-subunit dehydrogenase
MEQERSVALVTGASSGIGAAISQRLARDGRDVVLVARRKERLDAVKRKIEAETGVTATVMVVDLTEKDQLRGLEEYLAKDPRVDMVVNNAGFGGYGPFAELEPTFADRLIGVHVRAPMHLTRAVLPRMVTRGHGSVVNVASLLALSGPLKARMSGKATYAAAKSFLLTFTQALAVELEGTGVRVMVCLPGMVETEFFGVRRGEAPAPPTMMSAADVAQAVVVGLELGETICVPGLEDVSVFDRLRAVQQETLFGGTSGRLAERYRR